MQDGPTSGALCLASLEPRQDGTSAQVKGSNEGKKGGLLWQLEVNRK